MVFIGLCVLEIKTKGAETTAKELDHTIYSLGGKFHVCKAGTDDFRKYIREPSFRSQLCQHAAANQLQYGMLVYALPGGFIKFIVLVQFSIQLKNLLKYQCTMQLLYLKYFYSTAKFGSLKMPPIGNDYDYVYGYAQENHTVELYMRLWKTHDIDVVRIGTPPPFSKIIEATCSGWNTCMVNVDTVRKTL